MFSSTPGNESSTLLFAFGSSDGILTIDKTRLDLHWTIRNIISDVWALQFLSDKNDVLLSGGRGGNLWLNDFKEPSSHGSMSKLISHPSAITHIRQLDPHRILVAGLENSLCQYDMRYLKLVEATSAKTAHRSPPGYRTHRHDQKATKTHTRSVLQYPDYYNTATRDLGLDIDLEMGVVAAAQEANYLQPPVRLFSLWDGDTLRSPALESRYGTSNNAPGEHSRCLKFSRDVDNRMKSLYVSRGGSIQRFAWADEAEDG